MITIEASDIIDVPKSEVFSLLDSPQKYLMFEREMKSLIRCSSWGPPYFSNGSMAHKIAVLGVGNLLLRDEGVGVHVVNELNKRKLPENVEVHDCGTGGLSILDFLTNFDKVILVDAAKCGGEPGTVYRFRLDERGGGDKLGKMISLHELDLVTVMKIGRKTCKLPNEIFLIGIEPKAIELGLDLSPEVEKSIPEVVRLILEELK